MVAYTLYAVDPRVKRAARALAEKGHQVDVFAVFHEAAAEDSSHEVINHETRNH